MTDVAPGATAFRRTPFPRSRLESTDVVEAARALLGALLVRDDATGRRSGRIVEVEAYAGPEDAASHARFGPRGRSAVMFGRAGVAYVYLVYGMHHCLNVVTAPSGRPSAVLVRAIEPIEGVDLMRAARAAAAVSGRRSPPADAAATERARIERIPTSRLASGPALVAASFGLDRSWTGVDMCDPASELRLDVAGPRPDAVTSDPDPAVATAEVVASPRVGVDYAGDRWRGVEWRFHLEGHPAVSRRGGSSARRSG